MSPDGGFGVASSERQRGLRTAATGLPLSRSLDTITASREGGMTSSSVAGKSGLPAFTRILDQRHAGLRSASHGMMNGVSGMGPSLPGHVRAVGVRPRWVGA